MTIGMQDDSELLLRKLVDDYFGAQDDSDASAAAASHAAAVSYESDEPSSDEDAPAARCVDHGASLLHSRVWERWRRSPDHRKKATSLTKVSSWPH